jgi:hypothetical protein
VSVVEAWIVPVITALISLAGAWVSVVYSRRAVAKDRREAAEQVATRFTEPLLQAVFNLQTRIYNIVELGFFQRFHHSESPPEDREYAVLNTLYVVAQYFCWIEILRRDSQFVDPRNDERNTPVVRRLEAVRDTFSDSLSIEERCFRLFRGEQRALGEVMLVPVANPAPGVPRWECLGYAPFVRVLDDPQVGRWFTRLRADIDLLIVDTRAHDTRLRQIHSRLMDVIDIVDPRARRVPAALRKRLAPPATGAPAPAGARGGGPDV